MQDLRFSVGDKIYGTMPVETPMSLVDPRSRQPDSMRSGVDYVEQDLRKHAIYSVLKVGDRIPMIIAITLKSPDYSFKNKPKRIKQVPFLSKDNSVL